MATIDRTLSLIRAAVSGDRAAVIDAVERMAADERGKGHETVSARLRDALRQAKSPTQALHFLPRKDGDLLQQVVPSRTLDSLILEPDVRATVDEVISEHRQRERLAEYGLEPRHRLLLVGPPGNGKTSLAEALATTLEIPLLVLRYDTVVASYLGETGARLSRAIESTHGQRCVLLMDEFDCIGAERGNKSDTGEMGRVVGTLLMLVDALPSNVVLVAATNHDEMLDRAAWRRFDVRLEMQFPGPSCREQFILQFLSRCPAGFALDVEPVRKAPSYAQMEDAAMAQYRRWVLARVREEARRWKGEA